VISRRRELVARAGVLVAALAAVWLLIDARSDASEATRRLADQSDPTRPGSLAYRLAETESSRAELVAELAATRGAVDGVGRSVKALPGKFPTPAPATSSPPRVVIREVPVTVAPTPAPRPRTPPAAVKPRPRPRPPAASRPTPRPTSTASPSCLAAVLGVGGCPDA